MTHRPLVLVAIEHASDVERTLSVALDVAKARSADVHVLEVVPRRPVHVDHRLGLNRFEPSDERGPSIGARVASIVRSANVDGVRVRTVTLRGTPEHTIPAYAQLQEATLVVIERHYGSSRWWRNGRVAGEVARGSPVPVLVLPKTQTRAQGVHELRRILTPVDFSVASAVALTAAVDLSRRHDARITLLHALQDVPRHMVFSGSQAWRIVRRLPAQMEAVAERIRRRAASLGANDVDTEVVTGDVHRAIINIAKRSDADLIVMGVANRSWFDRLAFGSTLGRLLRRATVPVLIVPVVAGAHAWSDEPVADVGRRPRVGSVPARLAA